MILTCDVITMSDFWLKFRSFLVLHEVMLDYLSPQNYEESDSNKNIVINNVFYFITHETNKQINTLNRICFFFRNFNQEGLAPGLFI
jgi:hypothetical protein